MTRDDEVFVNGVWKKYNNYINSNVKDIFFKKHQYKNTEIKRKISTAASFILGMIATSGIIYAGVARYNYIQKDTTTDFDAHTGYDYNQDMLYLNGFYYKRIYNYNDYISATKMWDNLVEMEEKDFEESFVIIIAGENYDTISLYISDIYDKDEKMYIDLKAKDKWNENDTVISVKVSKELDRENVEINNIPNIPQAPKEYTDITELSSDYTTQEAINDGCFVVKNNEIISDNKDLLNEFMNNCKQEKEGFLRIFDYEYGIQVSIFDIEYKSGKINMSCRLINSKEDKMFYRTGNRIVKVTNNDINDKYIRYILLDEKGNQQILCSIKKDNS